MHGQPKVPTPHNEPVLSYAKGTPERRVIEATLKAVASEKAEIPMVLGGEHVTTEETRQVVMPHDHHQVLGTYAFGDASHMQRAIAAAMAAKPAWSRTPFETRAAILLKAADLLAGRLRARMNAATMLGQSKTVHQAEIDAACELIDFLRFNVHFAEQILKEQPASGPRDVELHRLPAARRVRAAR